MLIVCPHCAAQMPETAAFCPGCGRPVPRAAPPGAESGLARNGVAGAIAYATFVPAILFLLMGRYKKNYFVRFHAVQCLLFWGAGIVVALALRVASYLFFLIPVAGPLLILLMWVVAALAGLLIWLVLVTKALQGELFPLPLLGEFALQYAGESKSA